MNLAMRYIRIKGGYAYATNGHVAVKVNALQTFREGLFQPDETLYFKSDDWKKSGMYKAVKVVRENNYFKCLDRKGVLLGILECFTDIDGRFPDVDRIMPESPEVWEEPISSICVDPKLLEAAMAGCGLIPDTCKLTFNGPNRAILITPKDPAIDVKAVVSPGKL